MALDPFGITVFPLLHLLDLQFLFTHASLTNVNVFFVFLTALLHDFIINVLK